MSRSKMAVKWGLRYNGIIGGSYLFRSKEEKCVTVNGNRYERISVIKIELFIWHVVPRGRRKVAYSGVTTELLKENVNILILLKVVLTDPPFVALKHLNETDMFLQVIKNMEVTKWNIWTLRNHFQVKS